MGVEFKDLLEDDGKGVEYGDINTVSELTDRARATLYKDIAEGLMTPPVKIGKRSSAWPICEVRAVLTARAAKFDDEGVAILVGHLKRARLTGDRINVKKWMEAHRSYQRLSPADMVFLGGKAANL